MKSSGKEKLGLGGLGAQVEKVVSTETVVDLDVNSLSNFPGHPFMPYSDDKMEQLKESIQNVGLLSPIIVRRGEKLGEFIIISGHNRVEAFRQLGMSKIPASIKDVDIDTASIMMVDTNFNQRDEILPSEKAFAYKIKLNAMKSQGKRSDLTLSHSGKKLNSIEQLAEEMDETRMGIHRYIRLTELNNAILKMVDNNELGFIPAVDISYLNKEEQEHVLDLMQRHKMKPSKSQAAEMKSLSQGEGLSRRDAERILINSREPGFGSWKMPAKRFKQYLPKELRKEITPEMADEIVEEAMALWREKHAAEYEG